jgi:hypothetical protein
MATTKNDFDTFVKHQQELSTAARNGPPFDPQKQLAEWLGYLNALHSDIQTYLEDYIGGGSISLRTENKILNEEFSGPYAAPIMFILIGLQEIKLDPIGTMLVGSKGRVDVVGRSGTSRLTLVDKNITSIRQMINVRIVDPANPALSKGPARQDIDWVWKIMSRPPALGFIELNKESFLEMLLEVSNG